MNSTDSGNSSMENNIPDKTNPFIMYQFEQGDVNDIDSAHQNIHSSNQYDTMQMLPQQVLPSPIPAISLTIPNQNHLNKFFYKPSNDPINYHIECKKISDDHITQLLNQPFIIMQLNENNYQFSFFYKQPFDNQFYQISCEIVSPSLINKLLNNSFYDYEIEQTASQELLTFTENQKENLKQHLVPYLNRQLLN
ncbi:hypothetical protein C1645_66710 [Glomus cerebriforme]|uniref:Uncharacterized protein n=1 Tax=Glomus cerebriforme TaxID=658196 RepID=A0A397S9Z7_9GLOM|nr:hypothetical protein C1645_66710 [Glomus cerebriforme]